MARKRKIPARKHHGVRDPLKQQAVVQQKLKNVVNNPPQKGSAQKVSFKFSQFMKLANSATTGKKIKRIHRGREDKPKDKSNQKTPKGKSSLNSSNKYSAIKQHSNEDDIDYLRRVNRVTTQSLKEAEYEAKYGVSVIRDEKTGMISIKKRPENEIDELLKNKNKRNRRSQQKPSNPIDPKLARELIKQAIKEDNEEKKKETPIEEYKRDVFKFGEVVHAPPEILTLPRKAVKSDTVPRPGMKNNLLLKSVLNKSTPNTTDIDKDNKAKCQKHLTPLTKGQLTGKRKDLPVATRTMLEVEQSKMIDLYRQIKKNKQKT